MGGSGTTVSTAGDPRLLAAELRSKDDSLETLPQRDHAERERFGRKVLEESSGRQVGRCSGIARWILLLWDSVPQAPVERWC